MAAMLFADLGASIIRLDRLTPSGLGIYKPARFDLIARSRPSVAVNLKHPDGRALAADLITQIAIASFADIAEPAGLPHWNGAKH
jgi:alpha-methylacyl-CoA racemase